MVAPEPAVAPVILPVMVPMVQVKLLGAVAVRAIFGPVPLQIFAVAVLVTDGFGLTVTVIVKSSGTCSSCRSRSYYIFHRSSSCITWVC
jgi:hypothetical protein